MWSERVLPGVTLGLCMLAAAANAQTSPGPNTVTVHASKKSYTREVQDFVAAEAVPTRIGQVPRWNDKICPLTLGLPDDFNTFVSNRILEIANQVKAPVHDGKCRTNVLVLFAKEPQAVLDQVLKTRPELLGFYDTARQARQLATVKHPIQAWYSTATKDMDGVVRLDSADEDFQSSSDPGDIFANASHVAGSHLRSGLESQFMSVLVVADTSKIIGRPIGALADYIALLALTQSKTLDECSDLPTIANLFLTGCADPQAAATDVDLSYLRGLYSADPTVFGNLQQSSIARTVKLAHKPQ